MLPPVAIAVALRAAALLAPVESSAERPPAEVKRLIEQLIASRGTAQDAAVAELAGRASAEYYLRPLLGDRDPLVRQRAGRAVAAIHDRACRDALDRYATDWAKAGRVDMFVEVAALTKDGELAGRAADLLIQFVGRLRADANYQKVVPGNEVFLYPPNFPYDKYEFFSKGAMFLRVSSGELPGDTIDRVFAHSPTFSTEVAAHKSHWLCMVSDRLTEPNPHRGWWDSVLAVNNTAEITVLHSSLLIADGDVNLLPQPGTRSGWIDQSVIIARGSIRSKDAPGVGGSVLCAGGDITAAELSGPGAILYAGGRVRVGKFVALNPAAGKPVVKEGADLSFTGVRFFELSDVGADAADDKGGVRLTRLDPRSPLARAGLRVGDVVTKVNDQPTPTVHEFRRQVRRSVVLQAGVFALRRGGETLSRIASFDGLLEPQK